MGLEKEGTHHVKMLGLTSILEQEEGKSFAFLKRRKKKGDEEPSWSI